MLILLMDARYGQLGLLFLIFPILAYTSQFGTEFSEDLKSICHFSLLLGFKKKSSFTDLKTYTDLVIIKLGRSRGVNSFYTGRSISFDDSHHEIYVMTPNHRNRILVKVCQNKAEATDIAKVLSEKLNRKLVDFNPLISEKSQQTKQRGRWKI